MNPATSGRRSLAGRVRAVAKRRDLLAALTLREVQVRYKQALLGMAWAVFLPLSLMAVFTLVRRGLGGAHEGDVPYAVWSYCGLLAWTMHQTALKGCTGTLVTNRNLLQKVYFPRVAVQPRPQAAASESPPAPRGQETILVVEDEAGVRALVIRLLQGLGYRLLQAQSGPHAIEVWNEHRDEIDLLITDIVMPDGMNGVQLAEHLRHERPLLKVIFTSGYLADLSHEDISRHHSDAYIAKPFSLAELARLVRRTLDGGEAVVTPVSRDA